MKKEVCEACGHASKSEDLEKHHIVPTQVTKEAGMPESQTVELCPDCLQEVHKWYSVKIVPRSYDVTTKKFVVMSPLEIVKEYQYAFSSFAEYKKRQKKIN